MNAVCKAAKLGAILASLLSACAGWCVAEEQAVREQAQRILDMSGVTGGLLVHLGCGDGRLTAALGRSDRFVVHGLDDDDHAVAEARRYVVTDESWRRFCEEKGVDPEVLFAPFPGYAMLKQCDWLIRGAAPTAEEMAELLQRDRGDPEVAAVTADHVVAEWRELFDEVAGKWS